MGGGGHRIAPQVPKEADAVALLAYQPPSSRSVAGRHERGVNVAGAVRVGEAASRATTRVVFTSSADVYGPWRDEPVDERSEPAPSTPYAEAKLEAEHRLPPCSARVGSTSCGFDGVRPRRGPTPRDPGFHRSVPRRRVGRFCTATAPTSGLRTVEDVAAGTSTRASPRRRPDHQRGSGVGRSTRDVLRSVARVMDSKAMAGTEPSVRPRSRWSRTPGWRGESSRFGRAPASRMPGGRGSLAGDAACGGRGMSTTRAHQDLGPHQPSRSPAANVRDAARNNPIRMARIRRRPSRRAGRRVVRSGPAAPRSDASSRSIRSPVRSPVPTFPRAPLDPAASPSARFQLLHPRSLGSYARPTSFATSTTRPTAARRPAGAGAGKGVIFDRRDLSQSYLAARFGLARWSGSPRRPAGQTPVLQRRCSSRSFAG